VVNNKTKGCIGRAEGGEVHERQAALGRGSHVSARRVADEVQAAPETLQEARDWRYGSNRRFADFRV